MSGGLHKDSENLKRQFPPNLIIYRRSDDKNGPVPLSSFSGRQRRTLKQLERSGVGRTRATSCKASWLSTVTDVGVDASFFRKVRFVDADTIPTSLDAPTTLMKMSDMIS